MERHRKDTNTCKKSEKKKEDKKSFGCAVKQMDCVLTVNLVEGSGSVPKISGTDPVERCCAVAGNSMRLCCGFVSVSSSRRPAPSTAGAFIGMPGCTPAPPSAGAARRKLCRQGTERTKVPLPRVPHPSWASRHPRQPHAPGYCVSAGRWAAPWRPEHGGAWLNGRFSVYGTPSQVSGHHAQLRGVPARRRAH